MNQTRKEHFEAILQKITDGNCKDAEKEQFLEDYVFTDSEEDFCFVKAAADHGCVEAYAPLADRYAAGKGCQEDWKKAFQYWNLSIKNGRRGYADIGKCLRLGKGTAKDYDKAWNAYEMAAQDDEDLDGFLPQDYLLTGRDFHSIEQKYIELDWLKYAVKKQTKPLPPEIYGAIATAYFEQYVKDFLHWIKLGADAGDIGAKCILFRHTANPELRQILIHEIFEADRYDENSYNAASDLAKDLIISSDFSKQAVKFLYEDESQWVFEHYRRTGKEDELEDILRGMELEQEE